MFLAFVLGYVFGLIFYALYVRFLLYRAGKTQKRLGIGWLIFGRWLVMPALVVLSVYLVFGDLDANCGVAIAGYVASRAVRWIKVQMEVAPSDDDVLDAIEYSMRAPSDNRAEVASYMRQIKR